MCGIFAVVSSSDVVSRILGGLSALEYRGYDSTGIATLERGRLRRRRAEGKLSNLEVKLESCPLAGTVGVGHTRWATHGSANEANAHPHVTARLAVVHNGIIENFVELKHELEADGVAFHSETDTEVVAQLVNSNMNRQMGPIEAVSAALPRFRGAFALGFIFEGQEDLLVGVCRGVPLAVGHGTDGTYLGSDALALAPFARMVTYLDEGDCAVLSRDGAKFLDNAGRDVKRLRHNVSRDACRTDKGKHSYFMAKEIHEQPEVVGRTLSHYLDVVARKVSLPIALPFDFAELDRITITACGTAFHAGLVARYWFEQLANLPVEIDVASEARYRGAPLKRNGLTLVISQSGETADTLASLRYAASQGQHTLCVVNVQTSTIAREASAMLPTLAGPEIGVASTKTFSCQLTVLLCLAIWAGRARGTLDAASERRLIDALIRTPDLMAAVLSREGEIKMLSREIAKAQDVLYLGRGTSYPMALEGALKLKEISYIHAEGFAAGELKHGPIALIDKRVPVIVVAPQDAVFEKTMSNMQEVAARGGQIVLIGDVQSETENDTLASFIMPKVEPEISSIIYSVPLQLIAYHVSDTIGLDVDRPRNLSKSVTVE